MECIGCDVNVGDSPAAFAIMNEKDFDALEVAPCVLGKGAFHAGAVCALCFAKPQHRKRPLKAHFSVPRDLPVMLGNAGSTGKIGG